MSALSLLLVLGAAIEVNAPAGCVDPVEVAAALEEIGGVDVAERVAVTVTPRLDEYALVVDVALLQSAPLHREVSLRPRECADVADLVAVLVQGQRRAALEARLLAAPEPAVVVEVAKKSARPGIDPRVRPNDQQLREPHWSPCDGPIPCGGFRLGLAMGGAFPTGARFGLDTGWDVSRDVSAIAVGEVFSGLGTTRMGAGGGAAWRATIDKTFELSLRGLVGGGIGTTSIKDVPIAEPVECVVDETGQARTKDQVTWFVGPTLAARGRIGYVFVEVGTYWHVNIDAFPGAYFAIGIAPFGIL
ncbi:MAG: hypothetical protein Q8O67_23485 [Deltaproteobacteria bacterium]|nr:hypothetical protein [Deltaproteobacteria bacterium]